jgi:hypothetical protein
LLDRISPSLVPKIVFESTPNSRVAPSPILPGHLHNQLLDLDRCLGTADCAALAAITLLCNQSPVPPKQGV